MEILLLIWQIFRIYGYKINCKIQDRKVTPLILLAVKKLYLCNSFLFIFMETVLKMLN
jgi:hypothetical protein